MVRESVAHLVKVHGVEEVRALGPQEGGVWVRKSRARAGVGVEGCTSDSPTIASPRPPASRRGPGLVGGLLVRASCVSPGGLEPPEHNDNML